ncbi:hypothetical protein M1N23_02490 [Dehalococcoidia bacterium]|nr:hypothetical protein [Dehalococcoidia bacterium]
MGRKAQTDAAPTDEASNYDRARHSLMATPPLGNVVSADNIAFSYISREVIKGLSLSMSAVEVFSMPGPNGTDKPTFIRMLVWLIRPESGKLSLMVDFCVSLLGVAVVALCWT